jgi:SAM-dependent methyltransferase
MNRSWMLDELRHAGAEHLDPVFVAGFDRKQGHPDVEADLQVLRQHGALGDHATVVDLGTGTGRFALAAARQCGRVVAVDVSPAMIEHLRRTAADLPAIEVVRAGFLSYQHAGPAADAVYSRHALHQLPDFWKGIALSRIAGFLRPGGVLRLHDLVYDCRPADAPALIERWMGSASTDPTAGYTAEDYATHVRTEFGTYRDLLDRLIDATGFQVVDLQVRGQVYAAYTCIRR